MARGRKQAADWLAGRFETVGHIEGGGMADVWLAKDHGPDPFTPDRAVALKILRTNLARESSPLARFKQEGRAMIEFEHPNIVEVYDLMADGEDHFLVMEYVEGGSLTDLLRGHRTPLPPEDAVEIVAQVCAGIAYAHDRGIVHRDIKPSNVLLSGGYVPGDLRVKVTDFGIARTVRGAGITGTGAVLGTPAYMAPEVSMGKQATYRSDVYGCGALLYRLLTGTVPFPGEVFWEILANQEAGPPRSPDVLNDSIPQTLGEATLVALRFNPKERYESAEKLRSAIEAGLASEEIGEYLPTRFLFTADQPTGPTLYRRKPDSNGLGPVPRQREPWLPLLKFFATIGALLVLFAVVLRLTLAIRAVPLWTLVTAVILLVGAAMALRSPLFDADPATRTAARARLRSAAGGVGRSFLIGLLALYWGVLGYHLTNTVSDAIARQPADSHIWLEVGTALLWIAVAVIPLRWLVRSRMRIGRMVVVGVVLAFSWTAGAEILPEATEAVTPLLWKREPLPHRVSAEGKALAGDVERPRRAHRERPGRDAAGAGGTEPQRPAAGPAEGSRSRRTTGGEAAGAELAAVDAAGQARLAPAALPWSGRHPRDHRARGPRGVPLSHLRRACWCPRRAGRGRG
jgi:serine/threonine protein kinase